MAVEARGAKALSAHAIGYIHTCLSSARVQGEEKAKAMARIKERRKAEEDARRLRDQADETMSDAFEKRAKAQVGPRVLASDSRVLNMRCARRSNSEQLGIRRRMRAY